MSIGLLGKKLGMTHVYDEYGRRRGVTVIQAGPCTVIELRSKALQLGFEPVKESDVTKPRLGQFKKAGVTPFRYVQEFRLPAALRVKGKSAAAAVPAEGESAEWKVGQQLTVEMFQEHELVDVGGISVGKGFQGGMKRWHWRGGPETHGSMSHRAPGSIGSTTTPGRVWKGHHLPGHMGADRVTVQNVRIARLDAANNLLLVEGSVPGGEHALVWVTKSMKRPGVIRKPQAFQTVFEDEDEKLNKNAKAAKAKKPA